MKIFASFDYSKVLYNQDNTLFLNVKATAPKLMLDTRSKVNLVLVLDTSSSMFGDKLDYVKKSSLKLIENLGEEDTLSLITFDSYVKTLREPTKMTATAKDDFKQAILGLHAVGCTNFSGAILEAYKHAERIDGPVRVLLLTDGEPTTGETRLDNLLTLTKKGLQDHVTVTTLGYGESHDSKFLTDLSDIARGNYAYIRNPDDALVAFARELGGLMSCYAQNLLWRLLVS